MLIPLGYSAFCPCAEWGYGIPMYIPQRIAMHGLRFRKKMGTGSDPVPKGPFRRKCRRERSRLAMRSAR